jgi:hypothetical protein
MLACCTDEQLPDAPGRGPTEAMRALLLVECKTAHALAGHSRSTAALPGPLCACMTHASRPTAVQTS